MTSDQQKLIDVWTSKLMAISSCALTGHDSVFTFFWKKTSILKVIPFLRINWWRHLWRIICLQLHHWTWLHILYLQTIIIRVITCFQKVCLVSYWDWPNLLFFHSIRSCVISSLSILWYWVIYMHTEFVDNQGWLFWNLPVTWLCLHLCSVSVEMTSKLQPNIGYRDEESFCLKGLISLSSCFISLRTLPKDKCRFWVGWTLIIKYITYCLFLSIRKCAYDCEPGVLDAFFPVSSFIKKLLVNEFSIYVSVISCTARHLLDENNHAFGQIAANLSSLKVMLEP